MGVRKVVLHLLRMTYKRAAMPLRWATSSSLIGCTFLVHESGEGLPESVGEEMCLVVGSGDSLPFFQDLSQPGREDSELLMRCPWAVLL